MTILASVRDKKKRKVGVSQTRSRNYPILGGRIAARITLLHQDGASKRRVAGSIARMATGGQGLLPPPPPGETTACRPMWTRWMTLCRSTQSLTTTTLAAEPSPLLQEQNFLANDWKKKRRLKGAFLTVLRDRRERR